MKNNRWTLALTIFSILIFSAACDKKGEPKPPTQAELLTLSSWKFQAANYGGTDITTNPAMACFADDTLSFSGSNYTVVEGPLVCSPSPAGSGTWSFKGNDSLLLSTALVPGTSSGTFKINSLTSTNLVLAQNAQLVPPTPAQLLIVTFKH